VAKAIPPTGIKPLDLEIAMDVPRYGSSYGVGERFAESRDEMAWLRHLYDGWRAAAGVS
jgi:hypothetical protein